MPISCSTSICFCGSGSISSAKALMTNMKESPGGESRLLQTGSWLLALGSLEMPKNQELRAKSHHFQLRHRRHERNHALRCKAYFDPSRCSLPANLDDLAAAVLVVLHDHILFLLAFVSRPGG